MTSGRVFVVARDAEKHGLQMAIFNSLDDATKCYEEAAYVVRNAPGEGANDDPTIVTDAALFVADTSDPNLAKAMAADGKAFLMEEEEWRCQDCIPSRNWNWDMNWRQNHGALLSLLNVN